MCFCFGLEILRIVYKEHFLNIERFLSYLTFYPPKKVGLPFRRVEKNFLQIGKQNKWNFALISRCAEVLNLAKGEKIIQKKGCSEKNL
jgi:hypothetical protein